jgi:hypothetical protein
MDWENKVSFKRVKKNLESNVSLLSICDSKLDIPFWVLFRHSILTEINRNYFDIGDPHQSEKIKNNYVEKLSRLFLGLTLYNPLFYSGNLDFIFINSQNSNVLVGNIYINRIHDLIKNFVLNQGYKGISIDDTINSKLTFPRTTNTYFNTVFAVSFKKHNIDENQLNTFFKILNSVEGVYLTQSQIIKLKLEIKNNYSLIINTFNKYVKYFKKKKIRYLFLEGAYYGDYNTAIIIAAKSNNIKVIECQHGLINFDHIAYNFEFDEDTRTKFSKFFPDYLFTFGKFWSINCKLVNDVISFGYPFIIFSINNPINKLTSNYGLKFTLITSSSISREYYMNLIENLCLKEAIVFRPHPSEFANFEELYSRILGKCIIDIQSNVYQLIRNAEAVITEFSTILYESLYINKETKLLLTDYTRVSMNQANIDQFATIEIIDNELIESHPLTSFDCACLFNNDWESTLDTFIKSN